MKVVARMLVQHTAHGFLEVCWIVGFADKISGAQFLSFDRCFKSGDAGQEDKGNMGCDRIFFQGPEKLEPVQFGGINVGDNQIRMILLYPV